MAKKYYWLKLKEDFFDEDTISFIEEQENGVYYINFYLKLCLKSLKTEGKLIRLIGENLMPYDVKSLAKLTNTPIDTVRVAMKVFEEIGLIKVLETGEIYLQQINELIGNETDKARLMREKRAVNKMIGNNVTQNGNNVTQNGNNVTQNGNNVTAMLPECYLEKEIDIDIEKEKDIESNKPAKAGKGTFDNIKKMIAASSLDDEVKEEVEKWLEYKKERKDKYTEIGFKSLLTKIEKKCNEFGNDAVIDVIENSIVSGYQGIIWDKLKKGGNNGTVSKKDEDEFDYNFGLVL